MTDASRPARKAIPLAVKRAVLARQNHHCAECKTIFVANDKVEHDHRPALILRSVNAAGTDYVPAQNDARFIEALHTPCHLKRTVGRAPGAERTVTTKGSDAHLAAKFRKLEGKNKPRRVAKIPNRGFDKQKRTFR